MKIALAAAAFAALLAASPAQAGQAARPRTAHPYLAFSDENVGRLKASVAADPAAEKRWRTVLDRAKAAVGKPANPRDVNDALLDLSLAYRMTGERRYGEAARDLLTARASQASWLRVSSLALRTPAWNSDLGMGPGAAAWGNAYDAVYDLLTPQQRASLAAGVTRAAIEPILGDWVEGAKRIHALDTMGHNWWSHIVFGAGVAAIAILDEEPRAADWVRRVDEASTEWFRFSGSQIETKPATFGDDGSYSEPVHYGDYALNGLLAFRRAHREAYGDAGEPLPTLANAAEFFIQTAYPATGGALSLNFGDSAPKDSGAITLADLWALGKRDPRYLWYINQYPTAPAQDVWNEAINLPYLPSIAERAAAAPPPAIARSAIFSDQGWAMLRSSWQDDATLLGIKSGFTWNHNHADAGAFILNHQGQSLLIDSGFSPYSTPQYDDYYRQSVAHNVVLFDGEAEPTTDTYFGSHTPGKLDHLIDGGHIRYVWADATGPTSHTFARNFRSVLWVGDVILIVDDLKAYEPGQFEWLLHFDGEGHRDLQDIVVTKANAQVRVRPLFPDTFPDGGLPTDYPERLRLVEHDGLKHGDPKTKSVYFGFQPSTRDERENFIVAITPVTPGRALPTIERIEALNARGVRIRQDGKVTDVYFNLLADGRVRHRNANAVLGGFETDAYLLAVTYAQGAADGDPAELFVADGSYVRRGGRVLLDSLSKLFLHVAKTDGETTIQLDGQPNLNARIDCLGAKTLAEGPKIQAVDCVAGVGVVRRREAGAAPNP